MKGMEIVFLLIMIVLVVVLFVISYMRKKKFNSELGQMREDLKTGDKVMTDTGMVGEVVESFTEDEYKYFVLKSGKGNNVGYFTVHANSIYYVYDKENKSTSSNEKKVVVKVAPKTDSDKSEDKPNEDTVTENKKEKKSDKKTK